MLWKHRAEYQTVDITCSCYTCEETFTFPVFNVDHQEADVRGMFLCAIGFRKPNCEKPTVLRLGLSPCRHHKVCLYTQENRRHKNKTVFFERWFANNKSMGIGKTAIYVFSYVLFFFFPYIFLFLSFSFYVRLLYLSSAFSDFVIHLLGFLPSPRLFPTAFFSETLILFPILSSPHFFFSFTYVIITLLRFHIILFLFFFNVPLHSLIFFK